MIFFVISLLRKQGCSSLLEGSFDYILVVCLLDATCKHDLWEKKCPPTGPLLCRGEIKGSVTFFKLIGKKWFPLKTIHQLSIRDVKMLLPNTGKFGKHIKVVTLIFWSIFVKLGDFRAAKTRNCLLLFFALKLITGKKKGENFSFHWKVLHHKEAV